VAALVLQASCQQSHLQKHQHQHCQLYCYLKLVMLLHNAGCHYCQQPLLLLLCCLHQHCQVDWTEAQTPHA
jgi:hypothetical protein